MSELIDRPAATTPVDPRRWPDIAKVPPAGLRSAIARSLFRLAMKKLKPTPAMHLHRPDHFFRRIGDSGLIGFGESYMAGDWSADDLTAVLTVFASNVENLVPKFLQRLRAAAVRRQPLKDRATRENARTNISRHYDLSNELFAAFLDETMTYSAAQFDGEATWEGLSAAQHRKIDRLLDGAGVTAGTQVLEIGTGWGELAIRAAARGAQVRSITLSAEQRDLARKRIEAVGFADQVTVELCDYREVTGRYDAVVSIEMIEAVGYAYWPEFFDVLQRVLVPGGQIGLQAITMPHERMLATRNTYTWIHKYIFPGGLLPSVRVVHEQSAAHGMRVTDDHAFGQHYAETLRLWRERFDARTRDIARLGFDEMFQKMWRFYLAYSEAGFRAGYIDVHQFVIAR